MGTAQNDSGSWRHEQPDDGEILSSNQKQKHEKYVKAGGLKGPREWLSEVRRWGYRGEAGDDLRDGLAIVRGWTSDKGWEVEHRVRTGEGDRYYDAGKSGDVDAIGHEAKYGRVSGKHPHEQLGKDEAALRKGRKINWHVTDKSKIDKKVGARISSLTKKYPSGFHFSEISEAEKVLALEIGKEMRAHRYGNGKPKPSYYAAQAKLAETHAETIAKLRRHGPGGPHISEMDGGKILAAEVKSRTKALKGKTAALKDDLKAMQAHGNAHKKMIADAKKSPKGLIGLTKAIKDSSAARKKGRGATKSWIKTHGKLNSSMLKSPLGLMVKGITAMIDAVKAITSHWGKVQKAFVAVKKTVLDPVGEFFKSVFAAATKGLKSVTQGISNTFSSLGDGIEGVFKTVIQKVAVIVNAIGRVLQKLNIPLPDWLGGGIGLGAVGDLMVEWAAARMATGGVVRGPGGPRDDQVPIMASNGEFVVNAASTSRHIALLEAINSDSLAINGRDAQVIAVRHDAFAVPSRSLPHVVNRHHFDHSTTVNLTTNHIDSAHARAKTLATQREVAASWA